MSDETPVVERARKRANWIESISTKTVKCRQAADGTWGVSHHQVWVCGAYATRKAAARAPYVDVQWLADLWDQKCPDPITESDLAGAPS